MGGTQLLCIIIRPLICTAFYNTYRTDKRQVNSLAKQQPVRLNTLDTGATVNPDSFLPFEILILSNQFC